MTRDAGRSQDALQLEALLVSRAYLYALYNKLLGGTPDGEVLDALLSPTTADVVEEFQGNSPQLQALQQMLAQLRALDRNALLEAARDEYTRVLIGPANLPASPYESPYQGAHDMALFQENTVAVRREYHARGLRARREQAVPDDHVALMCAFMAEMGARALEALRSGDVSALAACLRDQEAFQKAHLGEWLDVYATSVRNSKAGAQHVLYPQMLEALAAFVKVDADFLAESAYWAEAQEDAPAAGIAPELAAAQEALDALRALSPFGIQDNELVSVD
ncbi:MAG: molecular chaperone TorD family protein [Coriobacteriia bacterium]|nr:molecular chaperone TorD family protein [Coriobacteriia bacterium]